MTFLIVMTKIREITIIVCTIRVTIMITIMTITITITITMMTLGAIVALSPQSDQSDLGSSEWLAILRALAHKVSE